MTKEFIYLLQLLESVVNRHPAPLPPDGISWEALYQDANSQSLCAIVFAAVDSLLGEVRPPEGIMQAWRMQAILLGTAQMQKNHALKKLLMRVDAEGLRVLLVKGPVLASLYPSPASRTSVDADVLIESADLQAVSRVFEDEGYSFNEEASTDNENTFIGEFLNVELHERLWEEAAGRRYDRLDALGIGRMDNAVNIEVAGIKMRTLPPQEMMFYLIYHMVKHFFVCGIGIRYISDLTLYAENYADAINWDKFWADIDSLEYMSFAKCFLHLCVKYMGLSAGDIKLPEISLEDALRAERMLTDFAEGGHNGRKTLVRYKAGRILRVCYENEHIKVPRSRWTIFRQMFFPKKSELKNRNIANVKYSKFLLFAWVQHLLSLFMRWFKLREERCSLSDRIDCAQERFDLLHDLGLIE